VKLELFYPNYSKKAFTFTIDDGNVKYDRRFIEILRPRGIKGTFNLVSSIVLQNREESLELYSDYEIANHCKYHPYCFRDGVGYCISAEPYVPGASDPKKIFRCEKYPGLYYFEATPNRWRLIAPAELYIKLVEECKEELEEVFGKGRVKGFVWPFHEQSSEIVKSYLKENYPSVRKTGSLRDSTGFAVPSDRMNWSYNASHLNLLEVAKLYDEYDCGEELRFFAFGVHGADYEKLDDWKTLETFAELYGDRPNDFWYAAVSEIFDYVDAANSLIITEDGVENRSDIDIYCKLSGKKCVIKSGEKLCF